MRRFLRKLTSMAVVFAGYLALGGVFNTLLFRSDPYRVPEGTTVLLAGDSHPRLALSPEIIDASVSVCQDAEPYVLTYYKLEAILDANPGIEVVVLGFAHHNLSDFNDQKLSVRPWAAEMFARYYPIVPWDEIEGIDVSWRQRLVATVRYRLIPNKHYLSHLAARLQGKTPHAYPYVGGYVEKIGTEREEEHLRRTLLRHFWVGPRLAEPSDVSLTYLDRIVELTAERGVQLVLVSTPVRDDYYDRIPGSIHEAFAIAKARYRDDPGVMVLDASTRDLPNSHFADFDHVNVHGAEVISALLERRLGGM